MPDDPEDNLDRGGESHDNSEADEKLLKQIREDYRYCLEYWREIREEAAKDMRYVAGDPWEPSDRQEREEAGRPCLAPDELSQYLKQANNNLRQNKRAIKVNPKGSGATDKDAEWRAAYIRGIEYKSNAQAAYTTAFENCTECSFGFARLTTDYISESSAEQEPRIKRIPNPFTVLHDPDAQEADFSDATKCFVMDIVRKSAFEDRFPNARHKNFSVDDVNIAPDWFQGENLVVAEYWNVKESKRKKLWFESGESAFEDKIPAGELKDYTIVKSRDIRKRKVTQYITNGMEILETNPWIGSWIPIIGMFGEEIYVNHGGRSKRMFLSLIRRARVPQMMMAFIASQEAEEFGMSPRAPFVGYKGQFESDWEAWQALNKVPRAFVQVDAIVESAGGQLLPLPSRPQFIPNVAAYEQAKESWRRAVQAAMGITPLPTAAQRQNEKSGVALERIQTQSAIGSFHFTDNFDRFLENMGRQVNELITLLSDTPREVAARNPDETHQLLKVTTTEHLKKQPLEEGQEADYLVADRGEFDVTISTGPSFQSEREEASSFVDLLISNIGNLPIAPQAKASLLAKAVKLKNIGPIGDDIAKILDPQGDGEPIPPQAQAAIAQLQQQVQALNAAAQKYEQQIQQLTFEKQAKILDNQAKMDIRQLEIEADITKAEITTKAQAVGERLTFVEDMIKQLMGAAHERAMAVQQQTHEAGMAEQQAQIGSAQSAQEAQQQQEAAAAQPVTQ